MAERSSSRKNTSSALQAKKICGTKSARLKGCEVKPPLHSAPEPTTKVSDDLLAKEEHYKLLNAKIEAKTADLQRQAELLMKEQNYILSKSMSSVKLTDFKDDDDDDDRKVAPLQGKNGQKPEEDVKVKISKQTSLKTIHTKKQQKSKTISLETFVNMDGLEEEADTFLAKTIQNMEERMDEKENPETSFSGDTTAPGISDAQARVLKAKLRILQEELDQLTSEYYKKDDENIRLNAKMKELEEDRVRLQKAQSILQTQIEKHKALAEDSVKKCEGLQLHVAGLNKEIENLNRTNKQAAALHNTAEIRLNRAMEESQRLKSEINKIKQINKEKVNEEHESKEALLAENKSLKKQKAELIVAFKKQLKLIDILKRQKMHFEAAKLLSFTEEEFVKALDWGGSF